MSFKSFTKPISLAIRSNCHVTVNELWVCAKLISNVVRTCSIKVKFNSLLQNISRTVDLQLILQSICGRLDKSLCPYFVGASPGNVSFKSKVSTISIEDSSKSAFSCCCCHCEGGWGISSGFPEIYRRNTSSGICFNTCSFKLRISLISCDTQNIRSSSI